MWPWEHLAVGYLAYSLLRRATGRGPPTAGAAVAVLVGSQFPDLVDKPLGWYVGVLPSGVSLAHSLLFAAPLCLAVWAWRARRGVPDQGVAFGVACLLHLPADAYYPALLGFQAKPWIMVWPLRAGEQFAPDSVIDHVLHLATQYGDVLLGPRGLALVGFELALLGAAALLWTLDGRPGLPASGTERPATGT